MGILSFLVTVGKPVSGVSVVTTVAHEAEVGMTLIVMALGWDMARSPFSDENGECYAGLRNTCRELIYLVVFGEDTGVELDEYLISGSQNGEYLVRGSESALLRGLR